MSLDDQGTGKFFEPQTLRVLANLLVALVLILAVSVVRIPRVRPDVATLVVVFLALEHELILGLVLAVAVGYLSDLFSGMGPGLSASTAVGVYLGLRLFVTRIEGGHFFMVTVLSVLGCAAALFIRHGLEWLVGPNEVSWSGMAPSLPWVFIGAVVLGFPVYRLMRAVDRRFRPREDSGFGARR